MLTPSADRDSFFGRSNIFLISCLLFLVALGVGFRLMNLTNPPLEFHAWRVLRSASIARGMYYEMMPGADPEIRSLAVQLGSFDRLEPNITERIVALTYLLVGGEHLWIARLYTTLFWMIGGAALFALAKRLTSKDGALVSLAWYLLLPFGNTVTRAFLPEPLMVMWILLALYAAYRWTEQHTWKWALSTGILSGMAVLTKAFAVFPLGCALVLILLATWGIKRLVRDVQIYAAGAIAFLIPALYYVFPQPAAGGSYLTGWTVPFLHMLTDVWFYISWFNKINANFNAVTVLTAAASILILEKRARALCLGLWIGYGLTGAFVPSLITSHLYYNLPLVPIMALSLAPIGALFLGRLAQQGRFWRVLFLGIALVGICYTVYLSRKVVVAQDFRAEPARWMELSGRIPTDGSVIGLTDDYNMRLRYYGWRGIAQYPHSYDQDMNRLAGHDFDENEENWEYFRDLTQGQDYFVITLFDELDKQPYLRDILYNRFPIYSQGDDYIIFDLRHPL
jgi:hypothetical protein